MAFDVGYFMKDENGQDIAVGGDASPAKVDWNAIAFPYRIKDAPTNRVRKVGLFEGHDNLGRLQPLLGTIGPATDMNNNVINWPDTEAYRQAGLVGPMEGSMGWHEPTTENVKLGDVEEWEIWNLSFDAHPIHLHLVRFELVRRQMIKFDSNANEYGEIEFHEADHTPPAGDGTYTMDRVAIQHDGSIGEGYVTRNPTYGEEVDLSTMPEYLDNFPRDVITALPGQVRSFVWLLFFNATSIVLMFLLNISVVFPLSVLPLLSR